jgi:hypothetical protein
MGTIARGDPFVLVVIASSRVERPFDRNKPVTENTPRPGAAQPRRSR